LTRLATTPTSVCSRAPQPTDALSTDLLGDETRQYRARLRATGPPALPFLGIVLSDVTFCSDGNPSTRRSPLAPDKQLINLAKYNGLWRIVADVRRFQAPFALAEVPEVQIFLSKVFAEKDSTSIEHLYRKSLSVEPRTSTTPAPGLP
jgi:son of sevenless-like protein